MDAALRARYPAIPDRWWKGRHMQWDSGRLIRLETPYIRRDPDDALRLLSDPVAADVERIDL